MRVLPDLVTRRFGRRWLILPIPLRQGRRADSDESSRRGPGPAEAAATDPTAGGAHDSRTRPGPVAASGAAGALAGGVMTYVFDPARGRRRRALMRDKLIHTAHDASEESATITRDARHRAAGVGARLARPFRKRQPTADTLAGRVRAELGSWCSHPDAIEVDTRDGAVTLSGAVLRDEVEQVRTAAEQVRGVNQVEDRLRVYESAADLPELQGAGSSRPSRPRPEFLQENWSPSARALAVLTGAGTTVLGLRARGPGGLASAAAGTAFAARGWTNLPLSKLTGIGGGRSAVTVTKTINIAAPVPDVYGLWSDPSRFPLYMKNVREVQAGGDGHTHWKLRGPLGTRLGFDSEIIGQEPDRSIAWATYPGSVIQHAGRVQFEPTGDDSTRVTIHLAYNPVLGVAGHGIVKLLGRDPKRLLDEDLLRLKTYLETGTRPHDAAVPKDGATTLPD